MKIPFDRDVDQFPVFEAVLKKRGRGWRWRVCTSEGNVVMQGSESIRPAAKYKADRALFLLLLSAPYRSIRLSNPEGAGYERQRSARRRCSDAKVSLTERTRFSLQEVVSTREGAEFIDENGGGPGVRLRKPNETKSKKR